MSNSKDSTRPPRPLPLPLFSLPEEMVLSCLARVPRIDRLSLGWVSKDIRALVLSLPELKGQLSVPNKKRSLYLCFRGVYNSSIHWFTLNETPTTTTRLVLNPTPFPSHPSYGSSTVVVGSKIFFIGGHTEPSTDLWILDTRSGTMTQGPSMSVPRVGRDAAAGVIDGKIYVIGGGGFHDEIQVEVFDPVSKTWGLVGVEYGRKALRCCASVKGKVYMVENNEIDVYNPREVERERMVHMVSKTLAKGGRKDRLKDRVGGVCVVEDELFAFFGWHSHEIMWFDTKRNAWRRLVGPDGKTFKDYIYGSVTAMAEHNGKLAVLYVRGMSVACELVSLHRAGDRICGTSDWSGFVATLPFSCGLLHVLAVSD